MEKIANQQLVPWFRSIAPYIHAHKGKTFVIGVTGDLFAAGGLNALVQDIALIQSLSVKIVLVYGLRSQIDEQLTLRGEKSIFSHGQRITNTAALACAQEAAGKLRYQIEAAFSQALPNTPMAHAKIRVISGNFITAQPVGILEGVDFQHTGHVRKLDTEGIQQNLEQDAIVLLSPFGYSLTGDAFNLTMEEVATQTAIALQADKLIFIAEVPEVITVEQEDPLSEKQTASTTTRDLSLQQAKALLKEESDAHANRVIPNYLKHAVKAVSHRVDRAHIIPYTVDGALLKDLFTHYGLGTMVVDEHLENLRSAKPEDVSAIIQMIAPREQNGALVKRNREDIERDISAYTVIEHDGVIFGSVAFYPYPEEKTAELAALIISDAGRGMGNGDRLLKYIEQKALRLGFDSIFVLTTQTMHWFISRGFQEVEPEWLPQQKKELYDQKRRSQVLVKKLTPAG